MKTSLDIVVRPTEIDVNGHVNNAKYLEYLGGVVRNGTKQEIFNMTY